MYIFSKHCISCAVYDLFHIHSVLQINNTSWNWVPNGIFINLIIWHISIHRVKHVSRIRGVHHTRVLILHATNSETNIQSRWQTGNSLFYLLELLVCDTLADGRTTTAHRSPEVNICAKIDTSFHFLPLPEPKGSQRVSPAVDCLLVALPGSRFDPKTRILNPIIAGCLDYPTIRFVRWWCFLSSTLTPDNKRVNFLGVAGIFDSTTDFWHRRR